MSPLSAWIFVIVFWVAPLAHVVLSRRAGSWRPPPGAGCPFGPRLGWLIIVLLAGAVGWILFMTGTRRRLASDPDGR